MVRNRELLEKLRMVAPGTLLRKGVDDILMAQSGALLLFVDDVEKYSDLIQPGFILNIPFSPEKLYELAKMDGAIILNEEATKITMANVHLVPDPSIPTNETGMRHRTADRIAKQIEKMAIAISRRRNTITLYYKGTKYMINNVNFLITRVSQGLRAIEKYKEALDRLLLELDVLELDDKVTLYDVARILEKGIKEYKIKQELEWFITELGVEGKLAKIQLEEMTADLEDILDFLIMDYISSQEEHNFENIREKLLNMSERELTSYNQIARNLGYDTSNINLTEYIVHPRGFRILKGIPRIPTSVIMNLVNTFKNLQKISTATTEDLKNVEGIGERRASAIVDGIEQLKKRRIWNM